MPVHREKESRPARTNAGGRRPVGGQTQRKPSPGRRVQTAASTTTKTVVDKGKMKKKDAAAEEQMTESRRYRTRTRTLSPTEVKQLTVERLTMSEMGGRGDGTSEGHVTKTAEETEQEYEDDFEDYESDFEEDTEEEVTVAPEPEPSAPVVQVSPVVSAKQRREVEAIKLAMRLENEATRARSAKSRQKSMRRGRDLLSMITLDVVSYNFLDVPSVPYEVYMRLYGRTDGRQVQVQTNEDDLTEETQTDLIEMTDKWVQKPPDAGGSKQRRLTKQERLGVGGDTAEEDEPVFVVDTTHLGEFLEWAIEMVLPALQSRTGNYLAGDRLPKSDMFFSDGYVLVNVDAVAGLRGRCVSDVCCPTNDVGTLITIHTTPMDKFSDSVICTWTIRDVSKPVKVLTAPNRVTAVSSASHLVFAGLVDGTVCLWDLKEPTAHHRTSNRSPTYTTALRRDGHTAPVVSVRVLSDPDDPDDFAPMQISSLESTGTVIIWSVVRGRSVHDPGDDDLGLAHWGRVKLVRSSSFPVIGDDVTSRLTCNDLALGPGEDGEMYVTNSMGSIYQVSKYGTLAKPKVYGSGDEVSLVETTCLEMCPFNPNYFLVGCKDGSIRLHSKNQALPLISLNGSVSEEGPLGSIVTISWLRVRPFVFFALDSLSRIHIWDLGLSDMYPDVTLNLMDKRVSCVRLIQSRDNENEKPHFVLATMDGTVEIHRLKREYSTRPESEIEKDVKKFLKYVSIL